MSQCGAGFCLVIILAGAVPTSVAIAAPTAAKTSAAEAQRQKKLARAKKLAVKKQYRQAEAALRELLAARPADPEVQYELAVVLASDKRMDAALGVIKELGASTHADAPIFRVETRLNELFASLRGDSTFRKAVRIDREPGQTPTAYERLVGAGGVWEQAGLPCEKPKVSLRLSRRPKPTFDLVIESSCRGDNDRTKLDGTWTAKGQSELVLTLPNPSAETENLPCNIEQCQEEDCVHCAAGTDMEFSLLGVRR